MSKFVLKNVCRTEQNMTYWTKALHLAWMVLIGVFILRLLGGWYNDVDKQRAVFAGDGAAHPERGSRVAGDKQPPRPIDIASSRRPTRPLGHLPTSTPQACVYITRSGGTPPIHPSRLPPTKQTSLVRACNMRKEPARIAPRTASLPGIALISELEHCTISYVRSLYA